MTLEIVLHLVLVIVQSSRCLLLLGSGGGSECVDLHFGWIYIHIHAVYVIATIHLVQEIILLVLLIPQEFLPEIIRLLKIESAAFKPLINTTQPIVHQISLNEISRGFEGFLFWFWLFCFTVNERLKEVIIICYFCITHFDPVVNVERLIQLVPIVSPETIAVTEVISELNYVVVVVISNSWCWVDCSTAHLHHLLLLLLMVMVQWLACIKLLRQISVPLIWILWVLIRLILLGFHASLKIYIIATVALVEFHIHHIFAILRSYLFLGFLRFVHILFFLWIRWARCISHLVASLPLRIIIALITT